MGTDIFRRVVLLTLFVKFSEGLEPRPNKYYSKNNSEYCLSQAKAPYFDIDLVVGRTWRVYYTWNAKMEDKCLDMTIRNATAHISKRFWSDMHEYMETQPVWDAATLYVTVGTAKHELLLFADQGAAGSFTGVPNIIKEGNISPTRGSVQLLKFFLKLLYNGNYLLMLDCQTGISSLMSLERPPAQNELLAIARSLTLGDGAPACVPEKKDTQFAPKFII